jgi:hypothetical protein
VYLNDRGGALGSPCSSRYCTEGIGFFSLNFFSIVDLHPRFSVVGCV